VKRFSRLYFVTFVIFCASSVFFWPVLRLALPLREFFLIRVYSRAFAVPFASLRLCVNFSSSSFASFVPFRGYSGSHPYVRKSAACPP